LALRHGPPLLFILAIDKTILIDCNFRMKKNLLTKIVLIPLGSLFVALGTLGVFVPGLPTTPFLLLAAACYVRSSEKLYNWLLTHRLFGKYISFYRKHKAMPLRAKVFAIVLMWVMLIASVIFFIEALSVKLFITLCGVIGTVSILLVKTYKPEESEAADE
jgi:uncharacterized membrane protein YbaN (DUF454 family)